MNTWKQICTVGLLALLLTVGITKAYAEIKEGVVFNKQQEGSDVRLFLKVNKEDLRPYDHTLMLIATNSMGLSGSVLNMMIEKGTIIKFEDEGMSSLYGVYNGDQRRIIEVDGMFILDWTLPH